jgi:hypothetical protein
MNDYFLYTDYVRSLLQLFFPLLSASSGNDL